MRYNLQLVYNMCIKLKVSRVTVINDANESIKVTCIGKPGARDRQRCFKVTVGRLNYLERARYKKEKKDGTLNLPIVMVRMSFPIKRRKTRTKSRKK